MFSSEVSVTPLNQTATRKTQLDISLYSESELLTLRAKIDERLPKMEIGGIDLESELVLQFRTVQALQNETLEEDRIDANKKASVINACASALMALTKLQVEVYTSERFKQIEGLMIKYLKTLPKETADAFMHDYKNLTKG